MSEHKSNSLTGKRGWTPVYEESWERIFGNKKKKEEPELKEYDDKLHSK